MLADKDCRIEELEKTVADRDAEISGLKDENERLHGFEQFILTCDQEPLMFWWSKGGRNFFWYAVHEQHIPAGMPFRRVWMDDDERFTFEEAHGVTGLAAPSSIPVEQALREQANFMEREHKTERKHREERTDDDK